MNPAVCIPYRPADRKRERAHEITRRFWEQTGWPVLCGDSSGVTFDRAEACNNAARHAPDADVLVFTDCDILPATHAQVAQACEAALANRAYTLTYTTLLVLSEAGTDALQERHMLSHREIVERVTNIWIASFAIPRVLYEQCGRFDERFRDYGGEDIGFLMAASTLGGTQTRADGVAYHLAHDPMDKSHPQAKANGALAKRYRAAQGKPDQMKALIGER